MAYGNGEIGLAQMKRLGDQRKAGVGDNGLCADEVGKEALDGRFLVADVAFLSFATKAICDERATHRTEQLGQRGGGRGNVNQHMFSLGGSGVEDFFTQQGWEKKCVVLLNRGPEIGN